MIKIFLNNRHIAISSDYEECSGLHNSVIFSLQALDDISYIVNEFIENERLVSLCLYTGSIEEDSVFKEISHHFTKAVAAGGLVKNLKNEVLMIYRFSYWDLPKGWHESNETIEETAIREVKEECSLDEPELIAPITITYHIYQQNSTWILKETHWFELLYKKNGTPKPQTEEGIEEVKWVNKKDIPQYLAKAYASVNEVFKASKI